MATLLAAAASRLTALGSCTARSAEHLGASQQAGGAAALLAARMAAGQLGLQLGQQARWHFGAHSQPQDAGAQAAGRTGHRPPERRSAGGRSTRPERKPSGLHSKPGRSSSSRSRTWQQAKLAFSRSKRQGRQLFGTQPQKPPHSTWGLRSKPEPAQAHGAGPHSTPGRTAALLAAGMAAASLAFSRSTAGKDGSSSEHSNRMLGSQHAGRLHKPGCSEHSGLHSTSGPHNSPGHKQIGPSDCWWWPRRSKRRGPPPTTENDASWELLLVTKTQWENHAN